MKAFSTKNSISVFKRRHVNIHTCIFVIFLNCMHGYRFHMYMYFCIYCSLSNSAHFLGVHVHDICKGYNLYVKVNNFEYPVMNVPMCQYKWWIEMSFFCFENSDELVKNLLKPQTLDARFLYSSVIPSLFSLWGYTFITLDEIYILFVFTLISVQTLCVQSTCLFLITFLCENVNM